MHDTIESKYKAAGPSRQGKGLRKGYDVLKKQLKEYEEALVMMIAFITFKSSLVPMFEGL